MQIEQGKILDVGEGYLSGGIDCKKYLLMPSFFNAHTHVGDSFAKEAALGLDVSHAVGEKSFKWELYEQSSPNERITAMKDTLAYMLASGTTGFADFREQGLEGVKELKSALGKTEMKSVILGRDINESECDGFGLNLYQTNQIPNKRKKFLALHAGEKDGEIEKAFECKPDVLIHFTKASNGEIKQAAVKKISVVVCPRSNSLLGVGLPKVREMIDAGLNVSLGTDNVMLNQPDMLREMEYLSKTSYLTGEPLTPTEVFRMATYNSASAFQINSGLLKEGMNADLLFVSKNAPNLKGSRNMLASVVHRCEPENIRKIMIDGNFVLDKDKK